MQLKFSTGPGLVIHDRLDGNPAMTTMSFPTFEFIVVHQGLYQRGGQA